MVLYNVVVWKNYGSDYVNLIASSYGLRAAQNCASSAVEFINFSFVTFRSVTRNVQLFEPL